MSAGKKDPRLEAFSILVSIEREGADLQKRLVESIAFASSGGSVPDLQFDLRDISLTTNIVYGVLRRRLALDETISRFLKNRKMNSLDLETATLLRMGAFQILYLSRIPAYAAVNESVNLAKMVKLKSTGLVNAILKKISSSGKEILSSLDSSTRSSLPQWLYHKITKLPYELDPEELNEPARMSFRVNSLNISLDETIASLANEGIPTQKSEISTMGLLAGSSSIFRSRLFREGLIVPQDEASQLAVEILDPQRGDKILDLCAGRGVKTTQIAVKTADQAEILAIDKNPEKLNALIELAVSVSLNSIATLCMDGLCFRPDFPVFDRVLIDAPCTDSGTIRRRPEIRYRIKQGDAERLSKLQYRLLTSGASVLKSGGTLVYSVCSFLDAEGCEVVRRFLNENSDLHLEKETVTFRDYKGIDGFYIAKLRRG